jgi:Fic family protein
MTWNWQFDDWPNFTFAPEPLMTYERDFLLHAGEVQGSMLHIRTEEKENLIVDLLSEEALKTSKIEGEILDGDSMQSSIRRQFGLATDSRKIPPAEAGVSEIMVDLYRTFASPLTHESLFAWHTMLMNGRQNIRVVGNYRSHSEPMQIISGRAHEPTVHFEAPPSGRVQEEMNRFIAWFNDTAPNGKKELAALERAGIAHLYFESIHPFEDGNGRIGRAISEKALSQALGRPVLLALAHTIESRRKAYYAALQSGSRSLDSNQWMLFSCESVMGAQQYTLQLIQFLIEKRRFFEQYGAVLNERQEKVVRRLFEEGPAGFEGGLSADKYISITHTSRATTTRDLQQLVESGALKKVGELRHTRYHLNL